MTFIPKIFDFTYFLITTIVDNPFFQYFLYMIILLFIIRAVKLMVCW